ncbi:MAG TPA: hypothetical protein VKQ11_02275 [Candidatus Sulfotelmatobacter sp.]|nr:hypothetical protein [Candidatus Sulfotelmatobacter sp.]
MLIGLMFIVGGGLIATVTTSYAFRHISSETICGDANRRKE